MAVLSSHLPETIEEMRQVFGSYSYSRVLDPEQHVAILQRRTHRDAPTRTGELDCVADQVLDDLKQSMPVSPNVGEIRHDLELEIERGGGDERRFGFHTIGNHLACGDAVPFQGEVACVHAADVEKISDQTTHPGAGTLDRLRGRLRSELRRAFTPFQH